MNRATRWGLSMLLDRACEVWGVTEAGMKGDCRTRKQTRPRQLFMWFAVEEYGFSLSDVGRCLHRDHTTILHGVRTIDRLLATDMDVHDMWLAFDADRPLVNEVRRIPPPMLISPVSIVTFHHFEDAPQAGEVKVEIAIDPVIADFRPVIDEEAMARRRMAGR